MADATKAVWDTSRSAGLLGALKDHYRKPGDGRDGEILLTEASPPGSSRRIDLLRIGLWQSRGLGLDGHELKVSRADWQRELDDKGKAEAWWPFVNRWWVVAPSIKIVPPEELPEGWGLLVPGRGRRFKTVVKAATKQPKVTIGLMVELIRRADNARLSEIDKIRHQHREELWRVRDEKVDRAAAETLDGRTQQRLQLLDELEQRLGVNIEGFAFGEGRATPAELGQVLVDQLREGISIERSRRKLGDRLEGLLRTYETEQKVLRRTLDELGQRP